MKLIDLNKSKRFNKYIDDAINDGGVEKDAKDFIKACAICNKETVSLLLDKHGLYPKLLCKKVNIDEWLFAFSKLFAVD